MLRKIIFLLLAGVAGSSYAAESANPLLADKTPPPPGATNPASAETVSPFIVVGGSDLLQTALGEPLTRFARQNNFDLKVDMRGSAPGLTDLKEGKVQLVIFADPIGTPPPPAEYTAIKLCFQVDFLIVNPTNPINGLNLRQIANIFGASQADASFWGQLQLSGEWTNRPVIPYSTSADDGYVLGLFKNLVLGQQALSGVVKITPTSEELIKNVNASVTAIGLLGYDPGPPSKVLLISSDKTATSNASALTTGNSNGAALPTEQTVFSGEYPLRLPIYLVYKPADQKRLLPILRLLLSDEYADHLREQHFMPVPSTERSHSALELDK